MHKAPTKGLLNSYRHCNQPLQKSPGSKICSFQEVFVGDSCQQPKVVLHRSELCLCYLRALANPQAASFTELNILHLRTTSSRASGQIGSSIVWTTITSMWHAFHQPWAHWLALQSHAKLVNIQVTRQSCHRNGIWSHMGFFPLGWCSLIFHTKFAKYIHVLTRLVIFTITNVR